MPHRSGTLPSLIGYCWHNKVSSWVAFHWPSSARQEMYNLFSPLRTPPLTGLKSCPLAVCVCVSWWAWTLDCVQLQYEWLDQCFPITTKITTVANKPLDCHHNIALLWHRKLAFKTVSNGTVLKASFPKLLQKTDYIENNWTGSVTHYKRLNLCTTCELKTKRVLPSTCIEAF